MAQASIQGQLGEKDRPVQRSIHLAGAEQNSHGHGQVEGWTGFLQACRGQVHCNAAQWKLAAAIAEGGPDPLPGFLDRRVR